MYPRILANVLESSQRSVLVLGPRQVGKSTLLASTAPDVSLNLASPRVFREFVGHPERLERELLAAPADVRTVFLDEVQRVPALLDVVQILLDEHPGRFRFLLSGSSARKLKRGQANLLPGRIHVHQMHPLLACELGEDFDLDRALAHGTLPGIYAERDAGLRGTDLRSYADTYLREEVQAEALVRNLGGFSRLLDLLAASSGRILNVQALCKQAGLAYETTRRYVEVLEDTLIMFRVPAWSGSSRSSAVGHPRLFIFDIGVRNALLRRPLDVPLPDERGILLEHFVACELHRRLRTLWPGSGALPLPDQVGHRGGLRARGGARTLGNRGQGGTSRHAEHAPGPGVVRVSQQAGQAPDRGLPGRPTAVARRGRGAAASGLSGGAARTARVNTSMHTGPLARSRG